ncbi:MAG: 50S ribosomal protein L24 [Candidatus Hodarchaeales archaeon]|jgi:large subunit ribosomal protein L24
MPKTKSPKKNRRRISGALHKNRKKMNVSLSSSLRDKYGGIRNLPVKKGDIVSLIKGKDIMLAEKKQISKVDLSKMRVQVEGAKLNKTDGTEILRWVSPANIRLEQLGKVDSFRQKIIDRRVEAKKKLAETKEE